MKGLGKGVKEFKGAMDDVKKEVGDVKGDVTKDLNM
jgi:Sec-independent protein translocase protein TatA